MSHIVLGAPGIERFHLLERLARELRARSHQVTVLCLDPVHFTFWSAQQLPTVLIEPGSPIDTRAPLRELAELDCRLGTTPHRRATGRQHRRLERLLPGVLRFFEHEAPDLVCLHQDRSDDARLIHFVARECGSRVLWTGSGLLPHTMQVDEEGLDGSARGARRTAWDFRGLDSNEGLLSSILTSALGGNTPPALARRSVQVPAMRQRLRDALAGLLRQHDHGCVGAFDAWQRAAPAPQLPQRAFELPAQPHLTVLLQRADDARLRLDAVAPPSPYLLVTAARAAARRSARDMPVVAVLPPGGLLARDMTALRRLRGVQIEASSAALEACLAALAVITINSESAVAGLLANTPVVHLGKALYGIRGVATQGTTDSLAADIARAMAEDQPELRRRFLTWLFEHGHIWCSVDCPDHNGISGFVLEIERRIRRGSAAGRLQYRVGPAWPLAAEGRG